LEGELDTAARAYWKGQIRIALTPALVAEITFAEFTADGRVRHASFLGLRPDKDAKDVTPETAIPARSVRRPRFR